MGSHRTHAAARIATLAHTVGNRRGSGTTLADLPHGPEIARQLAIIICLANSTDPADRERRILAANKAGALMTLSDDTRQGMLTAIAQHEHAVGNQDPEFWAAAGGMAARAGRQQEAASAECLHVADEACGQQEG